MRTQLIFNTEKLIKRINSSREFYKINKTSNMLDITKKYIDLYDKLNLISNNPTYQ